MKKIFIGLISIIVIGVIVIIATGDGGDENGELITLEEYNKLKTGMNYETVCKIVGSEGTKLSETGTPGTELYTFCVSYEGDGETGANAVLLFQDNKLDTKSQYGLK